MSDRSKKIYLRTTAFVGSLLACFLLVHFGRNYASKAWGNLRLVNVVVNLTPTIMAILFAFVVDKDLAGSMKWRWVFRISVVLCGVSLTCLLWHQQALADKATEETNGKLLTDSVTQANAHTDKKFAEMNTKVGGVQAQVGDVSSKVDANQQALIAQLGQTTSTLSADVGKVGKPDPPPLPIVKFGLWDATATPDHPTLRQAASADADGNYPVDFTFGNPSDTTAESVDIWVSLCGDCSFASEPSGFEKPLGIDENTRHMRVGDLNPGVSFAKTHILVKVKNSITSSGFFQVGFRYSCKNCGGSAKTNQVLTVLTGDHAATPPLPSKFYIPTPAH